MSKPTCGPLYKTALQNFTDFEPENVRIFAAGFIHGQAEKVYLGACDAAMFRPSNVLYGEIHSLVRAACINYDLFCTSYRTTQSDGNREIWICRDLSRIGRWLEHEENSPDWHYHRGIACGIPPSEIDRLFHERAGFGIPCDGATE